MSASVCNDEIHFPDGTVIPDWFRNTEIVSPSSTRYVVTQHGVTADIASVQTDAIQHVIDLAAEHGGGIVVFPAGRYVSGSVFFRPGVHLHLQEGATLAGSDDVSDFRLQETRMEGETVLYFTALVNADHCDGFTITGTGTLDGQGCRYWKAFWLRRKFNPNCTNMDEMRPRLLYISNSKDVTVSGIQIRNSPYWTTHYYRCERLKLTGLSIFAPHEPVHAPSTDAIDIDVCRDVLIRDCFMEVDDDAIALKGGKGPDAEKLPQNGENANIIVENCRFGYCHSLMTCGSETLHNRNVIVQNCIAEPGCGNLLYLKMRPDTSQLNEYILYRNVSGTCRTVFCASSWTQFKRSETLFPSYGKHVLMTGLNVNCGSICCATPSREYELEDVSIRNLRFSGNAAVPDPIPGVSVECTRI